MAEVWITTPRGVRLSGTFALPPVDGPEPGWIAPPGTAVLFAHGFLADRSSRGRADRCAAVYAEHGLATLRFDFSGCGTSQDDVVEIAREVEDLLTAIDYLVAAGYPQVVVHGHSLGALVALRAASPHVPAMVLTGAVTGPIHHPWDQVLSAEQVAELDVTGRTTVLDDGPSGRTSLTISRQTLSDFVEVDQAELLAGVACPVLVVHGGGLVDGEEHPLLTRTRVGMEWLPPGSELEVVPGGDHALLDYTDLVARRAVEWLARTLG